MRRVGLAVTDPVGPAEARCLVLGHSLGTSAALWADALPLLAQDFRVLCWELPGHGASPVAQAAFTVGDLSDALVEHLETLGVRKFLYAGVSITGTVGLDIALRHADRVGGVAVISSGARVESRSAWAERAASVRVHGTQSLVPGSAQRWFAPSTRELHRDRIARLLEALRDTDDESYACACEALADYDGTAGLARTAAPVLAVWGQYDELVPQQWSAEIARVVRRGALECVPDAAHASPAEQPATVADRLASFFGTAPGPVPTSSPADHSPTST
ncbi:alpha/beta hydrolase [Pseudonocardia kujensis]|uniref:alpha/beta fold hydrolase n=1 Tax=Pseudonocardia kujensis TaxID=1128675 RepID=UPI001E4FCC0F|nr:alpha/beta fold hydrolase [Pseudonocardia kujensis]MCE0762504.1 alpha/beta hydrolase [Pseudonocardia kujensis]